MGAAARTILLLEDDVAISKLLSFVLQRQGFRVLVAANGADALRIGQLHQNAVDLLLSDVVLRNETAAPVVAGVRASCRDARVLFVSGFDLEELLERGLLDRTMMAEGSAFFLQKPFSPEVLVQAVESVLDRDAAGIPQAVKEQVNRNVQRAY